MLDKWVDAAKQIGAMLFERDSFAETWILSVMLFVFLMLVFKFAARPLTGSSGRALFVLVPGFVLMIAGAGAVSAFLSDSLLYELLGAAVVLFVVVLPLTQAVQDTSYFASLLLWIVVLLTVTAIFQAELAIGRAIHQGAGTGSSMKQHSRQLDDLFEKTGN